MHISRVPLRISLLGGGSDLPEYYENGNIKLKGHLKFDMGIYDYVKYGTWHHYDEDGTNHKKDHY